jgi:hypothetical protein
MFRSTQDRRGNSGSVLESLRVGGKGKRKNASSAEKESRHGKSCRWRLTLIATWASALTRPQQHAGSPTHHAASLATNLLMDTGYQEPDPAALCPTAVPRRGQQRQRHRAALCKTQPKQGQRDGEDGEWFFRRGTRKRHVARRQHRRRVEPVVAVENRRQACRGGRA